MGGNNIYWSISQRACTQNLKLPIRLITLPRARQIRSIGRKENADQNNARSLVLLLATLTATVTYQAGLDPPGGIWQDTRDGHMARDPILLNINSGQYMAFFYCNSIAFVTSLFAIVLVQKKLLLRGSALQIVMILHLVGLIGAYTAGNHWDRRTSIYPSMLASGVVVYAVNVLWFRAYHTGNTKKEDMLLLDKTQKRFLLFAILAAAMTYQAGLTPPGGFLLQDDQSAGHQAGHPVLLYNFPRHYKVGLEPPGGSWKSSSGGYEAGNPIMHDIRRPRYLVFFYSNSISFMASIVVILLLLLVPERLFEKNKTWLRRWLLVMNTTIVLQLLGPLAAYAAGSSRSFNTSLYFFTVAATPVLVLVAMAYLLLPVIRSIQSAQELHNQLVVQRSLV